jgi:hypothetical protein
MVLLVRFTHFLVHYSTFQSSIKLQFCEIFLFQENDTIYCNSSSVFPAFSSPFWGINPKTPKTIASSPSKSKKPPFGSMASFYPQKVFPQESSISAKFSSKKTNPSIFGSLPKPYFISTAIRTILTIGSASSFLHPAPSNPKNSTSIAPCLMAPKFSGFTSTN